MQEVLLLQVKSLHKQLVLVNLQTGIQIKILNKKSNLLFNKEIELRRWARAKRPRCKSFCSNQRCRDLRTGSDIKLDDGKKIKITQKNAKLIVLAMDKVKPQMKTQLLALLGKNKQSHMRASSLVQSRGV